MTPLMEFLDKNEGNRGVLAILRQGLTPATELRAWPLLARVGGIGDSKEARAVRTVAGLFAYYPLSIEQQEKIGDMGATCRALCGPDEHPWENVDAMGKAVSPGPMSRKFSYLLNADEDEICGRVIRMVRYAKGEGVAVNYAKLETDLKYWSRRVRERWASAFWALELPDEANEEQPEAGAKEVVL